MDPREYVAYQLSIKSYRDIKSGEISSYELGLEKGEIIGLEKGEKLGIRKGEKLGLEKGEKLGIKKGEKLGLEKGEQKGRQAERRNLVQNLNKSGFTADEIAKATGLSTSEVQSYIAGL
jgi:predicted Rossmann fold nucleotide-binding protein DprA/Smf involved in DNA uptake